MARLVGERRQKLKMAAFVLFLAAALAVAYLSDVRLLVSRSALRDYLAQCGAWTYAGYLLAYALLVILGVPVSVLTVSGALAFGTWLNTALSVGGATLGACASFVIARFLARDWVAARMGARAEEIDRRLSREGVLAIILLRMLPVVPFNAVSYASGLTNIGLRDYIWASVAGMTPGLFAFSYATNQAIQADWRRPETLLNPGLILSMLLVLALLVVVPLAWRRRERRRRRR